MLSASANPKTIVVVKSGSAVLMPWIDSVAGSPRGMVSRRRGWTRRGRRADGQGESQRQAAAQLSAQRGGHAGQQPGAVSGRERRGALQRGASRWAIAATLRIKSRRCFRSGFGLSYTEFKFDGLKVSKQPDGDNATVSFTVTNTGARAGAAVGRSCIWASRAIDEGNEPPLQLKAVQQSDAECG